MQKIILSAIIFVSAHCDLIGYNRMGNNVKSHYGSRFNKQSTAVDQRLVTWLNHRAKRNDESLTDLFRLFVSARPKKEIDGGIRLKTYLSSMTAIVYK